MRQDACKDAFFFLNLLPDTVECLSRFRNAVQTFLNLGKLCFHLIQHGLERLLLLVQAVGLDSHQNHRDGKNQRDPAKVEQPPLPVFSARYSKNSG